MKEVTTFVGIDAHKKDLFVAMLAGAASVPVTVLSSSEHAENPIGVIFLRSAISACS